MEVAVRIELSCPWFVPSAWELCFLGMLSQLPKGDSDALKEPSVWAAFCLYWAFSFRVLGYSFHYPGLHPWISSWTFQKGLKYSLVLQKIIRMWTYCNYHLRLVSNLQFIYIETTKWVFPSDLGSAPPHQLEPNVWHSVYSITTWLSALKGICQGCFVLGMLSFSIYYSEYNLQGDNIAITQKLVIIVSPCLP